jgi:hypothetical protein
MQYWRYLPSVLEELCTSIFSVEVKMEAASSSEMFVTFSNMAWDRNPEDPNLNMHHLENLKSR